MTEFVFREPMNGQVFVELPTAKDGGRIVGFFATAKRLRDLETAFGAMAAALETGEPPRTPEAWVANGKALGDAFDAGVRLALETMDEVHSELMLDWGLSGVEEALERSLGKNPYRQR